MVEIISGEKGKGKTKYLLDKVNNDIKNVDGSVVYIDKNTRHMYELDSKIRLINMGDYFSRKGAASIQFGAEGYKDSEDVGQRRRITGAD